MGRRTSRFPCIVAGRFCREQVDPRIQRDWKAKYGIGAPFGALKKLFREVHCAELNPYASEDCPYKERDCAITMYAAVTHALSAPSSKAAVGYFTKAAWRMAQDRADTKPLAREATDTQRPRDPDDEDLGPEPRWGVRRTSPRPVAVGEVLKAIDPRSREGPPHDGEEGAV